MDEVIPAIDRVLEALEEGSIQVNSPDEVRRALLIMRRIALEGEESASHSLPVRRS